MAWVGRLDREPGDFGFDPLKLSKKEGFDMEKAQLQEQSSIGNPSLLCRSEVFELTLSLSGTV